MRIGFIGNMNNNHFAMVRYLRDQGVDAELLLFDIELPHFHPSCDTYDLGYQQFTRQLTWGNRARFSKTTAEVIRRDLAPYDRLVGCGLAPAYCARIGRGLDIFKPYGDDIWFETRYRASPHDIRQWWRPTRMQRSGIARSRVFHLGLTNAIYERQWEKFRGDSRRWDRPLPMVYAPGYAAEVLATRQDSHWGNLFRDIRSSTSFMAFYHARHSWRCASSDPAHKGTDRLLRGWAAFVKESPSRDAKLVVLEYGRDVEASRALIAELGVAHSVIWLPAMQRKDIMVGLALADICCGQFTHSWLASGAFFEALVAETPLLSHRDDSLYAHRFDTLYPIVHASEPHEIADGFRSLADDPDQGPRIGRAARAWYQDEIVEPNLRDYRALLESGE